MEDLITTMNASERIGITARQLRRYIDDGKLQATKYGRYWFIKPRDFYQFKQWYEETEPKPGPKPRPRP